MRKKNVKIPTPRAIVCCEMGCTRRVKGQSRVFCRGCERHMCHVCKSKSILLGPAWGKCASCSAKESIE